MKTLSARQDLACADLTLIVFPSHLVVHPSLAGWWVARGGEGAERSGICLTDARVRVAKDHPDVGTGSLYMQFVPNTIDCELQQSKLAVDYFCSSIKIP